MLNLFWGVLLWKRAAEVALEASGMNYCIVRPGGWVGGWGALEASGMNYCIVRPGGCGGSMNCCIVRPGGWVGGGMNYCIVRPGGGVGGWGGRQQAGQLSPTHCVCAGLHAKRPTGD